MNTILKPVEYHHIVGNCAHVTLDTEIGEMLAEPFCELCKAWKKRSEKPLIFDAPKKRAHVLWVHAPNYGWAYKPKVFSRKLTSLVLEHEPALRSLFREAYASSGALWHELLAPAQVAYCAMKAPLWKTSVRCGVCGRADWLPDGIRIAGTLFSVPEAEVGSRPLFYSAATFPTDPPDLVVTPAGKELFKKHGIRIGDATVAVLREADVDRNPQIPAFFEQPPEYGSQWLKPHHFITAEERKRPIDGHSRVASPPSSNLNDSTERLH